jgi:hypothetical protein
MMLVEKIRRTLPPRCDPGRMVGCSDSPNPNQPLGQLLALSDILLVLTIAQRRARRGWRR